jgi:ribose 5-phosphate isomerase B
MNIAIGNDHKGFNLKQEILNYLKQEGHAYKDFGSYDTNSMDYPDVAQKVALAVAEKKFDRGILICDTGIGMSIAANKVNGIRAAVCYETFCAERSRLHNDANVLTLGAGITEKNKAIEIVKVFLNTQFEGGRHIRRVEKIHAIESK